MEKIQPHAKLVVVGGGILGVSLLYHLTKEGWKDIVMISRTHGQPAVPTTLGKEFQVFHYRLYKQLTQLKTMKYYGKFGGAVGNMNAHYVAYPLHDWKLFAIDFIHSLGLSRQKLTTQAAPPTSR